MLNSSLSRSAIFRPLRRQSQIFVSANNAIIKGDSSSSVRCFSEAAASEQPKPLLFTKKDKVAAARDYNSRRKSYRDQVSLVRKEYFEQYQKQQEEEKEQKAAKQRELTRRRLERQRKKNVKSAHNAMVAEEQRVQRAREFEEHLRKKQKERDENKRRYTYARHQVLQDLEAESHLWLTTEQEVENAFTHEAEQNLWAFSHGVLGAVNPSVDTHFWQQEAHIMDVSKTFQSKKEILLENLLGKIYYEATMDDKYWTPERLQDRQKLVQKAKLRAMVRAEGRRVLLNRQKEMLQQYFETAEDEVPKRMPAPNVKILANKKVQEKEGVEILMKDPTMFFTFESSSDQDVLGDDNDQVHVYSGPTLGAPTGLRDPLRDGKPGNTVFPMGVGVAPKKDNRTQREKKRQEREQKLWEAAQAEKAEDDVENSLADPFSSEAPIDYDDNEWDSDDEEWRKGLDPVTDADVINLPPEHRYSEDDIRWVMEQLDLRFEHLESQLEREIDSSKQRLRTADDADETVPEKSVRDSLLSLSNEQMIAITEIVALAEDDDELVKKLNEIPGLDEDQVKNILALGRGED
jgi:hypothetical protein